MVDIIDDKWLKPGLPEHKRKRVMEAASDEWRECLDEMQGRVKTNTLTKLRKNYEDEVIDRVLAALMDFEHLMKTENASLPIDLDRFKEKHDNLVKRADVTIKAIDNVLKYSLNLDETEKKILNGIKARNEALIDYSKRKKKIPLGTVAKMQIKERARPNLLSDEPYEWSDTFLSQYVFADIIFTNPPGRPRKLLPKTLLVVLFNLLENKDRPIRWRYGLVAEISEQCLSRNFSADDVDSALHRS